MSNIRMICSSLSIICFFSQCQFTFRNFLSVLLSLLPCAGSLIGKKWPPHKSLLFVPPVPWFCPKLCVCLVPKCLSPIWANPSFSASCPIKRFGKFTLGRKGSRVSAWTWDSLLFKTLAPFILIGISTSLMTLSIRFIFLLGISYCFQQTDWSTAVPSYPVLWKRTLSFPLEKNFSACGGV